MAQFDHLLPDGTTLHALDVQTAQEYLQRAVWALMQGATNELIIGTAERVQAVVLAPDAWLHGVGLHDQRTQTGAEELARRKLDDVEREWQSEEHFAALLAGMPRDRADPLRPLPPFQEQRVDAVDVQIAVQHLSDVVVCLESGALEVLTLGENGVAEAVMICADYWFEYADLEDEEAGDERIAQIVRERKKAPLEDSIELDDFLAEFKEFDDDHE